MSKNVEKHRLFSRRNVLILLLSLSMLVAGGVIERYKHFGYRKIAGMVGQARGMSVAYLDKISQQYSRDSEQLPYERDVDSALLPLKISGMRLSEHYAIPKTGGAIAAVGQALIVMDRLGNFYSYRPGKGVEKLPFPSLPNNIAEYARRSDARIDDRNFRAHSARYSPTLKLLAVSHELFDTSTEATRLAVSVIGVDEASLTASGSWETIYRSDAEPGDPSDMAGGALAFASGNSIYLAVGDYWKPNFVQDPGSSFGKIVEINIATRQVRNLTLGHRNPQGLTVTKNGHLLSTEQGPAGGDELNHIVEGSNYGWPKVTLGTEYGVYKGLQKARDGRHEGYKKPIFAWLPSIAVSKLLQVDGFHPSWDGDLLASSLKGQTLFRLRLDGMHVLYAEPIYIGQRIRDVAQLAGGTIALWTDDTRLLFLSVDRPRLAGGLRSPQIHDTLRYACMLCHHFGPTSPSDSAPSLSNLLNRRIASDNFRYSAALRSKGDAVWTEENLRKFLTDTNQFASGTTMAPQKLTPDDIDEIIRDLAREQGASR